MIGTLEHRLRRVRQRGSLVTAIQDRLSRWRDRHVLKSVPRDGDPYASHLPVLIGLSKLLRIQRVLEFGTGIHSTPLFLNGSHFPQVREVHAYENDAVWGARVSEAIGERAVFQLHLVAGQIAAAAQSINADTFDLIFIDDSVDVLSRAATIEMIAQKRPSRAIVVIHDFEVEDYRRASQQFAKRFRFRSVNPNVGVLWNGSLLSRRDLRRVSELVLANRRMVAASDVASWKEIFDGAGSSAR